MHRPTSRRVWLRRRRASTRAPPASYARPVSTSSSAEGRRCPALVRQDCAQWNSELAQTLPTVVFGARDERGRDLFDVIVSIDGEPIVKKLDGKSVTVDPGKHTFRFEAEGFPAVSETVLIKEGERARVFNVTFDREGGSEAPTGPAGGDKGHTPYPWIVVGLGAVGVAAGAVIVVTSPDRPSNCDGSTQRCTRLAGQSDDAFRKIQEDAGAADSQPLVGYIVAGSGLALVAGGLVWHFLEPTGSEKDLRGAPGHAVDDGPELRRGARRPLLKRRASLDRAPERLIVRTIREARGRRCSVTRSVSGGRPRSTPAREARGSRGVLRRRAQRSLRRS